MRWVRFGYRMEWINGPCPPSHLPNQPSTGPHASFVDAQVQEMLAARAITPVSYVPHCVNPLGVVTRIGSSKLRLVLNMRFPNQYLAVQSFRMESLADLRDIIRPNDTTLSADLTQGYYHITLHPSARTYCGFCWR